MLEATNLPKKQSRDRHLSRQMKCGKLSLGGDPSGMGLISRPELTTRDTCMMKMEADE